MEDQGGMILRSSNQTRENQNGGRKGEKGFGLANSKRS